jgi:D-alanine-D-alanine ligase
MTDFGKVAVLMGGRSAERDISLRSGSMVLEALIRQGVDAHAFDPKECRLEDLRAEGYMRAFIALHGRFGEDGTVQGALECMGIPYTGSGVMGSAIAMDKLRTKLIWMASGIPTPKYALIDAGTDAADLVNALDLPLIVKPVREGSSIGVTKVTSVEQVGRAYELASGYDDVILAEQFVVGAEYTAAVLDGKSLPLIRIEAPEGNYDYQNKYYGNETLYHCPCGLDPVREKAIQDLAIAAFDAVGCRGWGRLDLMLDAAGNPWFLEVNTVPGMTDHSLVPMAARAIGISFDELVLRILSTAGNS